jgi:hypothetical protein
MCGCGQELPNLNSIYLRGHYKRTKEIINKYHSTCLKKYGVKSATQLSSVKEKIKKTTIDRYGVESINQVKNIKEKKRLTYRKNYGVDNPFQSEKVKKKHRKTCLDKYGVENVSQIPEVQLKKEKTCLKNYGVKTFFLTKDGLKNTRINAIKHVESQKLNGEPLMPRIGFDERDCLNELQKHTSLTILRQDPRFKESIGRFPDGYIEELNLVILFDESFHFEDYECTRLNQNSLLESENYQSLNCIIFRINQIEWLENSSNIINNFKNITGNK